MAQQFQNSIFSTNIAGAYASYSVATQPSNLAQSGIMVICGESSQGPDWTLEDDLDTNAYAPTDLGLVIAKYGANGRITNAFRAALSPSLDPSVTGAPSLIKIVKTNKSTPAYMNIENAANNAVYGTLITTIYGSVANNYATTISDSVSEVPAGFTATFATPVTAFIISVRVNGGAATSLTVPVTETPTGLVSLFSSVSGLSVTGGVGTATNSSTASVTVGSIMGSGFGASATFSTGAGGFNSVPTVGSTLIVNGSFINQTANWGSYTVVSANSNAITAIKLADWSAASPPPVSGTVTTPTVEVVSVSSGSMTWYTPLVFAVTATGDGFGKTLEIYQTSGSNLETLFYVKGSNISSGVIGTSAAPVVDSSAAERVVSMSVIPPITSGSQTYTFTAGGQIVLQVGYVGTTASLTIGTTTFSTTVVGGSGTSIASTPLSNFSTISQMAAFIGSFAGYTAIPFNATIGLQPPTTLDQGTYGICTSGAGIEAGRIKSDAYSFFTALNLSGAVTLGTYNVSANTITSVRAPAGLPHNYAAISFAAGGTVGALGGTTEAQFQAAIDACQAVDCNFIVPLISQDASLDIAAGLTDPTSTYLIDSVNLYVTKHCQFMFGPPNMGNRQGFLSRRGTLASDKNAAANLNNFLVSMAFQDVGIVEANGIVLEQPWANAVTAAAFQAAGFYQSIFFKTLDISNAVQAAGDFNPKNRGQLSAVLNSGLLPIQPVNGFRYVSDQTTYGTDSNPIFNSIQAVYAANLCALTLAQRMETAYVGKSLADVNASVALASIDMICKNLFDSKLIASSVGAPKGYNSPVVNINGNLMEVSLNIFLATSLYFIFINFSIDTVNSVATG